MWFNHDTEAGSCISAIDISCSFRKKQILKDVSFEAGTSSCIGIVGSNGSGKSTLLSILAGTQKAASGSFMVFGQDLFRNRSLFPRLIAYLPQENPLIEDLSALDNLKLWYGRHIPENLPVFDQLQLREMLPVKAGDLSGGMKRRLSIACAIAGNQKVLIMDEPTSALDLHQKEIIRKYIRSYKAAGGIILLSTHDVQEIKMCDALYYLDHQSLIQTGADEAVQFLKEGSGFTQTVHRSVMIK